MNSIIALVYAALTRRITVGWATLLRMIGEEDCKSVEEVRADYSRLFFDHTSYFSAQSLAHDNDHSGSDKDLSPESIYSPIPDQLVRSKRPTWPRAFSAWGSFMMLSMSVYGPYAYELPRQTPALTPMLCFCMLC